MPFCKKCNGTDIPNRLPIRSIFHSTCSVIRSVLKLPLKRQVASSNECKHNFTNFSISKCMKPIMKILQDYQILKRCACSLIQYVRPIAQDLFKDGVKSWVAHGVKNLKLICSQCLPCPLTHLCRHCYPNFSIRDRILPSQPKASNKTRSFRNKAVRSSSRTVVTTWRKRFSCQKCMKRGSLMMFHMIWAAVHVWWTTRVAGERGLWDGNALDGLCYCCTAVADRGWNKIQDPVTDRALHARSDKLLFKTERLPLCRNSDL